MKRKFRSIGRVAIALVLALSLSLVMAVPVSAAAVGTPTVALSSYLAGDTDVEYTISFDIGASLGSSGNIVIDFDDAYVSPASVLDNEVTLKGVGVFGSDVAITGGDVWTISLEESISMADNPVVVVITSAANLPNPVAGPYTLSVATSAETATSTATYDILALPTVLGEANAGVQPDRGNAGETMWVEVNGTGFTGTAAACTTSFTFGTGVEVVDDSYHWISDTEVDCQITIASDATAGARTVTATSAAGTALSPPLDAFTVNSASAPQQVDAWDTYTPVTDLANDNWSATTLAMTLDNVQTTIDAAINAVSAGTGSNDIRVIRVHEATYTPQAVGRDVIDVDIDYLNLVAFGSPVIVPVRDGGQSFDHGVISITADHATIDGFDLRNAATFISGDHGIRALGTGTNFTIQNNTVSGFGSLATASGNYVAISAMTADGTIKDNTVEDNRTGIELSASDGTTIQGNLVQNNRYGIDLFNSDDALVIKNRVLTNRIGIYPHTGSTGGKVYTNDIVGNTLLGLYSEEAVDASHNWWGDISGPSAYDYLSLALGSGNTVSQNVTYDPWLTETQSTTVTAGIAYFGSTMVLEPGWNTLSVPLKLKGSANTITEIAALGDFLTDTNWQTAYQYNPVLVPVDDGFTGGWETPTELVPGRGYYIKILGTANVNFPVLYSGELGLPTYDLDTGWNLIGSAFGIDKVAGSATLSVGDYGICSLDDPGADSSLLTYGDSESEATSADDESWKAVDDALASLGANASVVVSPSLPGQEAAWGTVASDDATFMVFGEGYWVFMEATDTLAGFEVTPIYKVFLQ